MASNTQQTQPPPRRAKESDSQYASRTYRWECWRNKEPRPDLYYTSDTEVAEYRAWAGTTELHRNMERLEYYGI